MFQGPNNETIFGGQIGATNSELDIHQLGGGLLMIASPLVGGTGSVVKDGSGTLVLTGPTNQVGGITNGSTAVTGLNTAGLYVGEAVSGVGLPAGDYVTSISGGTVTLASAATTPSPTGSTLTFGTPNSYTGATLIEGGLLQAGNRNAFSPNSAVTLSNVAGAAMDLNGFDQVVGDDCWRRFDGRQHPADQWGDADHRRRFQRNRRQR